MLSWAKGQVFLPGGGVASIDYETRLAEARQAVEKAGDSRDDLLDRLERGEISVQETLEKLKK